MCSHFSFMSHEATSCSCSQQASRLGACISLEACWEQLLFPTGLQTWCLYQ